MESESEVVITPAFQASFPNIFTPRAFQNQEPKYSVVAVFRPAKFTQRDKAALGDLKTRVNAAARERWGKPLKELIAKGWRSPFRPGAEKSHLAGFDDDCVFSTLSSTMPPGIVDLAGEPIQSGDTRVYPGCILRASVGIYAYDNVTKGVGIGLRSLQWLGHGTRLGGAEDAQETFKDQPVDDVWVQAAAESEDESLTKAAKKADDFDDDIPF